MLGLYARSVEGALATTAVQAVIDTRSRPITYSSAGHPPPVLVHSDGTCDLLDHATDPPLGARAPARPPPAGHLPYTPGDTLVLYTDGLIERRGEDIDTGLHRLTDALARYSRLSPERLADTLLDPPRRDRWRPRRHRPDRRTPVTCLTGHRPASHRLG